MEVLTPLLLDLLASLGAPWFVSALAVVFVICVRLSIAALGKPATRANIGHILDQDKSATIYRAIMTRVLSGLERWLTPQAVNDHPKPESGFNHRMDWWMTPRAPDRAAAIRSARAVWSWPVLDKALLFAVAYPILLLILYWTLTGRSGALGALEVLPAEPDWRWRAALISGIVLLLLSGRIDKRLASSRIRVLRQVSGWTWLFALAVAVAVAGAGAFALAGTVAGAVALVVAGVFALTFAAAFAVTVALSLAVAFAVAVAVVVEAAFSVAAAFAVAFVVAVAVAFAVAARRGRGLTGYLLLLGLCLACLFGVAAFIGPRFTDQSASLLVFLGLLPILNGLFDFASYAATLGLACWGLRGASGARAIAAGVADAIVALALFTALGLTLLAAIALLNRAADVVVYDLHPLFASLRSDRALTDNWWLFAMLFSTALPTCAHYGIASMAALELLGPGPRRWLLRQMDRIDDSLPATIYYHGGIALIWTLAVIVPLLLIGGMLAILWHFLPLIGQTYLQVFEAFAVWLGLIDLIGPGYLPPGVWT